MCFDFPSLTKKDPWTLEPPPPTPGQASSQTPEELDRATSRHGDGLVLNLCPGVMNEVLRYEVAAGFDEPAAS